MLSCLIFGNFIPETLKALFLSVSLSIKSILLFILPIIIFSFAFYSFAQLKNGLMMFTILLLSMMCISNLVAVLCSYYVGMLSQDIIATVINDDVVSEITLEPLFELTLPKLCDNAAGLLFGILLGIYTSTKKNNSLRQTAKKFADAANKFLHHIFIPVLPLFILGFILKLQHTGALNILFKNFLPLLLVLVMLHCLYIGTAYLITMNFNMTRMIAAIRNLVPAAIVGFSTMSSAAALPVLTAGAVKNVKDQELAQTIIPSIINTHMLGDALGIPLMALSLYMVEYHNLPEFSAYFAFAISYVLAKFAAAGVPGGTIIVMIPVLESNLQFTPEMSGIILMMYILFDPFCTTANIFGNGLFPIIFEKIWCRLRKKNKST
nr:cation:dicarboxylase symporter family transporter [Candidatus Trichorickettsia mobilis]